MARSSYRERDYAFGQMIFKLRTSIGLTQSGLAKVLGISRRAMAEWEAGSSHPKAEHLKHFIVLGMRQRAFPANHEAEEIHALWKAAHQKVPLDEQWLFALLEQASILPPCIEPQPQPVGWVSEREQCITRRAAGPQMDCDDALAVQSFYGRRSELGLLAQWIERERCHIISILGIGGIGKSALAVSAMYQLVEHFEIVIWRSLRDAPLCEALLTDCLQVLSPDVPGEMPANLERQMNLLLAHLHQRQVLIVLDNFETLLEEKEVKGRYRAGYEGYGNLLRRVAEAKHQSCLILTSREKPVELRPLEGGLSRVRSLRLAGLDADACGQLLAEKNVSGTPQEQAHLASAYAGNPLALKIVAETISDLFRGEIGQFLVEGLAIFGGISDLLDKQFTRLSLLEQTVMRWLAILREPVTIDELLEVLVVPPPRIQIIEAIDGLSRRSLIERGQREASFTLQLVVMEYVTTTLLKEMANEIRQQRLDLFLKHGLELAQAREHVRQAQRRLLVAELLTRLSNLYQGRNDVGDLLLSLLLSLRELADYAQGYGPANVIVLLCELRGNLRGLNLAQLSIRAAYLQGVEMQDTSLAGATLLDTVLTESIDAAWAVAISHSGEYWAVGSRRGEVCVWRKGGQWLHLIWRAHTDTMPTLAFSPDERTLATGSWDGAVKMWDLSSGALLWTGWHTQAVKELVFAPDGRLLASAGEDGTVRLWDGYNGRSVQVLQHPGPVYAVAWSRDGALLASGGFDGKNRLWAMQGTHAGRCIQTLEGHTSWIYALAFAPDSTWLMSGSIDRTVRLWEVSSGHLQETLSGHTNWVRAVAWSSDGSALASCSLDTTIRLWDFEKKRCRKTLSGHTAGVHDIAFTPDSHSLLSGSEDGTLRLWDVQRGECVRVIEGYAASFYDVAWSPDSMRLVSGGTNTFLTIWDVAGGTLLRELSGHTRVVFGVTWSPDGQFLASGGWDNTVRLWDASTGACLASFQDPDNANTIFFGVAWSPDGRLLASGSLQHGVHVWDIATRTHRWVAYPQQSRVRRVLWSPDSTCLASCSDDGFIYVWAAADGALQQRLEGHHGIVANMAWSSDGSCLVSCGGGRSSEEMYLWDVHSGERLRVFFDTSALPGLIYAVAWNSTEDVLISGDSNGLLCWWEVQSGRCFLKGEAHRGAVQSLRSSPDGRLLASCGEDGAIKIWDMQSAKQIQTLRRDRPYERLNITGIKGLTELQKATLRALGAIDEATRSF